MVAGTGILPKLSGWDCGASHALTLCGTQSNYNPVEEPSWLQADSIDLSRLCMLPAASARGREEAHVPAAPSLQIEYTRASGEQVQVPGLSIAHQRGQMRSTYLLACLVGRSQPPYPPPGLKVKQCPASYMDSTLPSSCGMGPAKQLGRCLTMRH